MSHSAESILNDDGAATRVKPMAVTSGSETLRTVGPFDPSPGQDDTSGLGSVIVTGLLVIYPALAIVAAVVVGLRLSGAGA